MTNNNSIHEWIINNFLKNISKCTAYRAGYRLVSYNYLIQYFSLKQKKKKQWNGVKTTLKDTIPHTKFCLFTLT